MAAAGRPAGLFALTGHVNATAWMGRGPGSCKVREVRFVRWAMRSGRAPVELEVVVSYRPRGLITREDSLGRWRVNGWVVEARCQDDAGNLLDAAGGPLPDDADPVYLPRQSPPAAEFNDFDFGDPATG
jgi:hypothetical protein